MARFIELVHGVAEYVIARRASNGNRVKKEAKRKIEDAEKSNKRQKSDPDATLTINKVFDATLTARTQVEDVMDDTVDDFASDIASENKREQDDKECSLPPTCLSSLTVGINAVTRQLEFQSKPREILFSTSNASSDKDELTPSRLHIVLVCKADISPIFLVAHLPQLIAACNSNDPSHPVKLVPLPKNSEASIAEALGIRRAAVVALDVSSITTFLSVLIQDYARKHCHLMLLYYP